ncbi:MAG: SMP-30/gluconolactonase/LRE family protein [Nitrospinae bacterium]|nr:SMP-30/gluconolactonase/LRE family protein [Nitrospinota bacterium]
MIAGAALLCLLQFQTVFAADARYPYKDIGDGKPATSVILTLVDGMAVDRDDNIYIAHRSKNRIRRIDRRGTITTVAGNGDAGFGGDGGPALKASLNFPAGLAVDRQGNIFIADRNNHRVRKVDRREGIITTVAGNGTAGWGGDDGPATAASLNFPSAVALDRAGDLYISDRSNNRIRKVDKKGVIATVAGRGLPEYGGDFGPAADAFLKYPFGIVFDKADNLYIADRGNNRVRKVDARGVITTVAGDGMYAFSGDYGPATRASLAFPTGVAADDEGNVYIADRNNNRIRMIDSLGIISTIAGTGKSHYNGDNEIASETNLHLPFALALDANKNLLVVDRSHFRVRRIDRETHSVRTVAGSGEFLFKGDGGPGPGASLSAPSGIAMDGKGNVVFADKQHHRIRKIDPKGIIDTIAGNGFQGSEGDGGPALKAAIYLPSALTADRDGNIYLASRSGIGWNIRKIDPQGKISLLAGNGQMGTEGDGGPAMRASFYAISDISADNKGVLYVADQSNPFVRKIDKNGTVSKVAENSWKELGDKVHPNGVAADAAGHIYVSDSAGCAIWRIDAADGKVSVFAGTGDFEDSGDDGPALSAGIRSPGGLAFSPQGELYVAEEQSNRIRRIDKNGIISRVAGTGEPGFSGDGGAATDARLKGPHRMVFDAKGNLYFTDRDNNHVRKIDARGVIASVAGNQNIGWMQDGLEVRITVQDFP